VPVKSSVPIRRILVNCAAKRLGPWNFLHTIRNLPSTLVDFGCSLLEIPIEMFMPLDAARISILLDDIRFLAAACDRPA
jgi:hypothetical protein